MEADSAETLVLLALPQRHLAAAGTYKRGRGSWSEAATLLDPWVEAVPTARAEAGVDAEEGSASPASVVGLAEVKVASSPRRPRSS